MTWQNLGKMQQNKNYWQKYRQEIVRNPKEHIQGSRYRQRPKGLPKNSGQNKMENYKKRLGIILKMQFKSKEVQHIHNWSLKKKNKNNGVEQIFKDIIKTDLEKYKSPSIYI